MTAACSDLIADRLARGGGEVPDDDVGAFVGRTQREQASDPAAAAGDQEGGPGKRMPHGEPFAS